MHHKTKSIEKQNITFFINISTHSCSKVAAFVKKNKHNLNTVIVDNDPIIHLVTKQRCHKCCKVVIQANKDCLTMQNDLGITPLMLACERNDTKLCMFFIEKLEKAGKLKSALKQTTIYGETAFHIATAVGHYYDNECFKILLKYMNSEDANVQTNNGVTPLHQLVFQPEKGESYVDTLVDFINEGADPNLYGTLEDVKRGEAITPLQLAFLFCNLSAILVFMESGLYTSTIFTDQNHKLINTDPFTDANVKLRAVKYVEEFMYQPKSLKVSCRVCIRKVVVQSKPLSLLSLWRSQIPKLLLDYLTYENVRRNCKDLLQNIKQS